MTPAGLDLICVGGGVAGWTAARRAQQLGLRPLVLEKHHSGPGWGNGRISGGFFHAAAMDPAQRDPEEIYAAILRRTAGGCSRQALARAFADGVGRALEFLREEGGDFRSVGEPELCHNVLQPVDRATGEWRDRGPDRLLTQMWRAAVEAGAEFRPGRRVVQLLVERGQVVGVVADASGSREVYRAAAVLLADGGFHANADLVRHHITGEYLIRGSHGSDVGDALVMATAIGAQTVNMEWFYGHCQSRDAVRNDRLWPFPSPWSVMAPGLTVDGHGERFADEGMGDEVMADRMSKSRTPAGCWAICDARIWRERAAVDALGLGSPTLEPDLRALGGSVVIADTIANLAELTGLPLAALSRTLDSWNSGQVLDPPRTGERLPLTEPPYYAVPLIAGITFTMGGLLVDECARVLDERDRAIPGLYAAGGSMGGLQGGPGEATGYVGGWSEAATFALLAAEQVARTLS